jgi:hypothetical protein
MRSNRFRDHEQPRNKNEKPEHETEPRQLYQPKNEPEDQTFARRQEKRDGHVPGVWNERQAVLLRIKKVVFGRETAAYDYYDGDDRCSRTRPTRGGFPSFFFQRAHSD